MVYYVEFPINWGKYKHGQNGGLFEGAPDAEWSPIMTLLPHHGMPMTPHQQKLLMIHGCTTIPWEFPTKEQAVAKAMSIIEFEEQHKAETGVTVPMRIVKVIQGIKRVVWFDPRMEARQKIGELGGTYS